MSCGCRRDSGFRPIRPGCGFGLPSLLGLIALLGLMIAYAGQHHVRLAGEPAAVPAAAAEAVAAAPILVVTSPASTFASYYPEILRTEGLNAFAVADIAAVSRPMLDDHDLVVLASMPLSDAQAAMFADWVERGGNLVAMAPPPQLAALLGIAPTGLSIAEGYLQVDGSSDVGRGIAGQTMQFHGTAQRYRLDGAAALATLYATATAATEHPAVTLHRFGSGQAAAFAYDLATSVVLMRQGNPAWAEQERDGMAPIRSDDKFYGDAAGDPQADWIDASRIAIPQADEQQRLFANLILRMNLARKPLPRFWYFPYGKRAVVIMTADDHARNGTASRFEQFIAKSPPGCSLERWECVRGTSYIFPDTPLTNPKAAGYAARGFEIGLHVNTGCKDFTPASLEADYRQQLRIWQEKYRNLPAPATQRHHCVVWSDWASGAKVQSAFGMRLDVSYYHWPPGWARDVPGIFTGSAMPMRFADLDGSVIDVYGAATQMTDESGQSYPYTVDTLLDRALGAQEYFGAYTVNAHTDWANSEVADAVVDSALKRGVPIVSSRQMLTWLDARDRSSFRNLRWNGRTLGFAVSSGSAAPGLQALLPLHSPGGRLSSVSRDGIPLPLTPFTAKGIEYLAFPAGAGNYVAAYGRDSSPPAVERVMPPDGATGVDATASVAVGFSEPVDPASIGSHTFALHDAAGAQIAATLAYDPATRTATLTPNSPLPPWGAYTVTLAAGGAAPGITDTAGNPLAADASWSFSTGSGFLFPAAGGVAQPRRVRSPDRIPAWPDYGANPAMAGTG